MIDLEGLAQRMDGDMSLAKKFVEAFIEQTKEQLPRIRQYLDAQDGEQLSNLVHIVKSQTGFVGEVQLSKLASDIEAMIDSRGEWQVIRSKTTELVEQLMALIDQP